MKKNKLQNLPGGQAGRGDGLEEFYEPTADPKGEVVLMLTATPQIESRFVIIETGEVLKNSLGGGRWSDPHWR